MYEMSTYGLTDTTNNNNNINNNITCEVTYIHGRFVVEGFS